jgi:hypothetical protein
MRIHPVFHVQLLKAREDDPENFPGRRPPPPTPEIKNGTVEYEVETVLDRRLRRNKVHYLVKWKGYDLHDATWEPESNLVNAREAIKDFERNDAGSASI